MGRDNSRRTPEKPRIAVGKSNAKDLDLSSIFVFSLIIGRVGENPLPCRQVDRSIPLVVIEFLYRGLQR